MTIPKNRIGEDGLVTVTVKESWCEHRPKGLCYRVDPVRAEHLLQKGQAYLGKPRGPAPAPATAEGEED